MAFAEQAEPHLRDSEQIVWLRRLETEHDNLQAALAWAIEHGQVEVGLRLGVRCGASGTSRATSTEGRDHLLQLLNCRSLRT